MTEVLIIIPLLAALSMVFLYRHTGKREVFRLDSIQFFQTFVVMPLLFIWLKQATYLTVTSDIAPELSAGEIVAIDSGVTLVFLYLFAFVVMHALTTSFKLRKRKDPLYDIFHHTEYFHLWFSHLGIFLGIAVLLLIMAIVNLFFPLDLNFDLIGLITTIPVSFAWGGLLYISLWLSDPKQEGYNFVRLMQFVYSLVLAILLASYYFVRPALSVQYGLYWLVVNGMIGFVGVSLFVQRYPRSKNWLDRLTHSVGWGDNIQLFKKKK